MSLVIKDDLEILNLLNRIKVRKDKLWIWQSTGQRVVHFATIRKVDPMKRRIEFVPCEEGHTFRFNRPKELFMFYGNENLATKLTIRECESFFFATGLPKGLNGMDEDFLEKYSIVEMENEAKFKHLRNAPRKSAQEGQSVGLDVGKEKDLEYFSLHDISQGGMGFIVSEPGAFQIGEKVLVACVDGRMLPTKINGEIVAVRKLEDDYFDNFKIGVKFT